MTMILKRRKTIPKYEIMELLSDLAAVTDLLLDSLYLSDGRKSTSGGV